MLSLWRRRTDDSGFCRCGLYTYETWLIAKRQNLKLYLAFCPVRRVDAVALEEAGRLFKRKPTFCLKENTSGFLVLQHARSEGWTPNTKRQSSGCGAH